MTALRRLRALARVELRSVVRNKARSALVVTLIAIPVAALVAGSIVVKGFELSPIERVARQLGDADILVAPHPSAITGVLAALPAGCRVDRVVSSPERLVTGEAGCAVMRCAFDAGGAGAKLLDRKSVV